MDKYYIFPGIYEYSEYMVADLNNEANCTILCNKGLLSIIEHLLLPARLASRVKLPGRSLLYGRFLREMYKNTDGRRILVFIESNRLIYCKEFIDSVKTECTTILYLLNSSFQFGTDRIEYFNNNFDYIVSYDKNDCLKYGWHYYGGLYSIPHENHDSIEIIDVLFVGRNKGRVIKLREIYKLFTMNGFNCVFYITGVDDTEIIDDGIVYNRTIPYKELLKLTERSKAILEYNQEGQEGFTFRLLESIAYNKLLITNNHSIASTNYYDPSNMVIFSNDNPNLEEVQVKMKHTNNDNFKKEILPQRFIEYIDKYILCQNDSCN